MKRIKVTGYVDPDNLESDAIEGDDKLTGEAYDEIVGIGRHPGFAIDDLEDIEMKVVDY